MTIPVVWWVDSENEAERGFHPISRGYWDQGMLEEIFARTSWEPVEGFGFEHHVIDPGRNPATQWPAGEKVGVCIVPARHHASPHYVERLNAALASWATAVVILTGDEGHEFPWREITGDGRFVWVMTPQAGMHDEADRRIITGYPPGTHETLAALPDVYPRPFDAAFAGQVTHERRTVMFGQLEKLASNAALATDGFTKGVPQGDYLATMAKAKCAPCPSGPVSQDSFRLAEALEAGCIPLADDRAPGVETGFWGYVLDERPPFPLVTDWEKLPYHVQEALTDYPDLANRCGAWWQGYKRRLAYWLDDDLRKLGARPFTESTRLLDHVSAIVTTSPIPSNPDTTLIEETVQSIRDRLPCSEIFVTIDGIRPGLSLDRCEAYREFARRLLRLCSFEWSNVLPIMLPEWSHQANAARRALAEVRTPVVLFAEHDTPLVGEIDTSGIVDVIESGEFNVIRLHHEVEIPESHMHLMPDAGGPVVADARPDVPLIRTVQWSQRPHFASTRFYRDVIERNFAPDSRTMIEDVMHGVVQAAWNDFGEPGWWDWRMGIYGHNGDVKRSTHTDGRGSDEKGAMFFAYPGDVPPPGAPASS